ncbi:hypothetical protein L228DRAFT_283188 [Xylona heveae TC161]|uniref:Acyltransferase 3 domain-containing protein n=1 Tax=Xylona heveae (strain CBS 132557 / TC161) TaxID=1328760 RepID=A0A165GBE4_XYLHT|nr:hypothetical protein L228DRAFT_283188 [Xylona heveae TC161]KZF21986.1 hypothetical protein L228DRAFT_283188 [Xylona heveae TC161]
METAWSRLEDGSPSNEESNEMTQMSNGGPQPVVLFDRFFHALRSIGLLLLPSPIAVYCGIVREEYGYLGTTKYLTGLRGAASLAVFAEHFLMRFHPHMLDEYGSHPRVYQLPGIRLLYSGSVMVSIFFFISGFSLSIQPLKAIYSKDWEHLHHVIFSASLRRAVRLILPPAIITFVVMIGVRFGLYQAHYDGPVDMDLTGPARLPTFALQFLDWMEYVLGRLIYPDTWLRPLPNVTESDYAVPLYTIPQELWSSFILFMVIIALSKVKPAFRLTTVFFLIVFSAWSMRKEISCFLGGMILAELHLRLEINTGPKPLGSTSKVRNYLPLCLWTFVLGLGVWLGSIPHARGAYGSSSLGYCTISKLIPWNSNVYTVGAGLMVLAIDRLPFLRALFSCPPAQYLGQISFALYIVHWPILASWGWAVVPFMWKVTGNDTAVRYEAGFALAVFCVTPVVLWAADFMGRPKKKLWSRRVKQVGEKSNGHATAPTEPELGNIQAGTEDVFPQRSPEKTPEREWDDETILVSNVLPSPALSPPCRENQQQQADSPVHESPQKQQQLSSVVEELQDKTQSLRQNTVPIEEDNVVTSHIIPRGFESDSGNRGTKETALDSADDLISQEVLDTDFSAWSPIVFESESNNFFSSHEKSIAIGTPSSNRQSEMPLPSTSSSKSSSSSPSNHRQERVAISKATEAWT